MTSEDYMPVLKYWFAVNDLAEIKADNYPGNNLVIYSKYKSVAHLFFGLHFLIASQLRIGHKSNILIF